MAAERIASEGGKEGKKKEVREKKKAEKEAAKGGGGEKGRLVAVDWALGKEDWKKAQEEDAEKEEKVDGESGSEEGSSEDDDSEEEDSEEEEDEDSDMSPVPEGAEDSDMSPEPEAHPDDEDDELEEEPKPTNEGTTLFVRNISFETTEAELYDLYVPPRICSLSRVDELIHFCFFPLQFQTIRKGSLRSYCLRSYDKTISRYRFRLHVERR